MGRLARRLFTAGSGALAPADTTGQAILELASRYRHARIRGTDLQNRLTASCSVRRDFVAFFLTKNGFENWFYC